MRKLDRLKKEALEACKWRGHKMKRFVGYSSLIGFTGTTTAYALCEACHRQVVVCTKPPPNEIEIGGEAVALNCSYN